MATQTTEAALQGVIDREAIRNLPLQYCHCVWQQDTVAYANLFTEDGSFGTDDPSLPKAQGRDALRTMIGGQMATSKPRPFIHNHVVELTGPDTAKGTCYVEVRLQRDGAPWLMSGYYHDQYAKVGGEWKFKSRQITVDSFAPVKAA